MFIRNVCLNSLIFWIGPPKRFDYSHWVGEDWGGKPDLSCGTKGCALGWSTTIPSFRKLGLVLKRDLFDHSFGYVTMKHFKDDFDVSFKASKIIFGTTEDEFEELFVPHDSSNVLNPLDNTATPKQVAKHIRKFVANKYPNKKA